MQPNILVTNAPYKHTCVYVCACVRVGMHYVLSMYVCMYVCMHDV